MPFWARILLYLTGYGLIVLLHNKLAARGYEYNGWGMDREGYEIWGYGMCQHCPYGELAVVWCP